MPADNDRLEVFQDAAGDWRWRRVAANNRVLCTGEAHTRETDAARASLRSCPDLDPAWVQPPPPADTTRLDLVNQMLAASSHADREAARRRLVELLG